MMRHDTLVKMMRLETAAEDSFLALSATERAAYLRANPDSVHAMSQQADERVRLMGVIARGLARLGERLSNSPAQARLIHRLHETTVAGAGSVERIPHHERMLASQLGDALKSEPDDVIDEHEDHGKIAGQLLQAGSASLRRAADAGTLEGMMDPLEDASHALRMSNHLQSGNPASAFAHMTAIQDGRDAWITPGVRGYLRRNAGPDATTATPVSPLDPVGGDDVLRRVSSRLSGRPLAPK